MYIVSCLLLNEASGLFGESKMFLYILGYCDDNCCCWLSSSSVYVVVFTHFANIYVVLLVLSFFIGCRMHIAIVAERNSCPLQKKKHLQQYHQYHQYRHSSSVTCLWASDRLLSYDPQTSMNNQKLFFFLIAKINSYLEKKIEIR